MTALQSPGITTSGTQMHYGNPSPLVATSMQASLTASPRSTSAISLSGPSFNIGPTAGNSKRKRRPAGTPDPTAEVVALSPKTLMESDRYVCEICSQGFQRDQNLQMHRRKHKVPWKLLKRSTSEVRKRVYVCPDLSCLHHDPCHALGDLVGIKKHYRRKHSYDKQWKCEKCSKGYAVQSDYKAHLKTCGTRGHCCDCGRVFSRVESFIEHQDTCNAATEKTAVASSEQASLASLGERDGSASPSVDTVSVNDRSVGGFVGPKESTARCESARLLDHRELQLLPAKQYFDFDQSSGPADTSDRQGNENFSTKKPEYAFVSQSSLIVCSPTLARSNSLAVANDIVAPTPRLQLSIGLSIESSQEAPYTEQKECLSKDDKVLDRLASWSDLNPASLTSDASVTAGSGRSSTTTNNEVNRQLSFSQSQSIRNETPECKALLYETVEDPTAAELGTTTSAASIMIEENKFAREVTNVVGDGDNCKLTWMKAKKVTEFEAATLVRKEAGPAMLTAMRWDSQKELIRSQAEVSTSGSASRRTWKLKGQSGRWRGEEEQEEMRQQAREQFRLAVAYAKEAKVQTELAEADLRNATRIREHAQAQLLQAYLFRQQATRRIDASRLQITCQACRQNFQREVSLSTGTEGATHFGKGCDDTSLPCPSNLEMSSSMDAIRRGSLSRREESWAMLIKPALLSPSDKL